MDAVLMEQAQEGPELCPQCEQAYLAEAWQQVCDACREAELLEECGCPHDERSECSCGEDCPNYGAGLCPGYAPFERAGQCDLCLTLAEGRRHYLFATFVNGAALYPSLCTPCYRWCLSRLDHGEPAPGFPAAR